MNYIMNRKDLYPNLFVLLISIIGILFYYVINPTLIFVQVFALVYIIIAYFKFAKSNIEFLYFVFLLLLIIDFSFSVNITNSIKLYYYHFIILIYALIFAVYFICNRKSEDEKFTLINKYSIFFVCFIFYVFISVLWSTNKFYAIKYLFIYLSMFSTIIIIIKYNNSKDKLISTLNFLIYIYWGVTLTGLLEIAGIRFGMRNHFLEAGYSFSNLYVSKIPVVFFFNPNDYAFFIVIMLVVLNYYIVTCTSNKKKIFLMIIFILGQVNLIFTASRTGWICLIIALLAAIVILLVLSNKNKKNFLIKNQLFVLIFVLGIFFILSIFPYSRPYYGKIEGMPIIGKLYSINAIKTPEKLEDNSSNSLKVGGEGSNNIRYTLIHNVVDSVIINKHYLGFGVGNSIVLEALYNNTNDILNVHSLWFELLADFGIGIFLYCIFIYIYLVKDLFSILLKEKNEIIERLSLITVTALIALIPLAFAPSSIISHTIFWIVLALAISLLRVCRT